MKKFVETLKQTGRAIRAMNLPNKLTLLRVALVPLYLVLLWFFDNDKSMQIWPLLVFVLASLTDLLDGYLARSRNLITNFGKFMDPIADKLLVTSALVVILAVPGMVVCKLSYIPVIVILCREILVSGLREFLMEVKVGMPVTRLAKWKTGFQMTAIAMILLQNLPLIGNPVGVLGEWLLWVAGILTFITGYQYFEKCLDYIYTVENNKKNPVKQVEQEVKKIAVKVKNSVEKAVVKKAAAKRGRKAKTADAETPAPKKTAAKAAVKNSRRRKKAAAKTGVKEIKPAATQTTAEASPAAAADRPAAPEKTEN